jgi:arginyl-tRNA synthetase
MKINQFRFLVLVLFTSSVSLCYSQVNNDSLKQILSSKSFTIEEEYIGDWGSHFQTFLFKIEGNMVKIKSKNPDPMKSTEKESDMLISINMLKKIEDLFIKCSERIKTSKNISTEHIIYKFKNENITYIIDDKFTMECYKDFKTLKETLFIGMTKTEVSTIGVFDGQTYMGVHGESVYKINAYNIYIKDISKSLVDSLKGKKVLVTGKLNEVKGKTQVTENSNGEKIYKPSLDFFSFISEPKFSIIYDNREPIKN